MTPEQIANALGQPERDGTGWKALCPCHDDSRPSLGIHLSVDGRLLVKCRAGCDQQAVWAELGARGLLNGYARQFDRGHAPIRVEQPQQRKPPLGTPAPRMIDSRLGAPCMTWTYRDEAGAPIFHTARYDTAEGKQVKPWTWDGAQWIAKAPPKPRPLYGLDRLAANPSAPVLVVEGEKCAAAAEDLGFVPVTWQGGCNAVLHADWSPLEGREVTIWPDADDAGQRAAHQIAALIGACRVLDVSDMPKSWDIADAVAEGRPAGELLKFIEDRAVEVQAARAHRALEIPSHVSDVPPPGGATDAPRATWPQPLDLVRLAGLEPQAPRFIIDGWLPAGYASLFSAHGGSGKSTIALLQAVCIALGLPFAGLPTQRRRVLYLSCEDRESVLHWRLSRICAHLGVSMASLAGWLDLLDLVGHDSVLWITNPGSGASYTPAYDELAARIGASGSQVVYVDGIADVYGGEENSRAHVKQFVNALVGMIDPEDGAIVLIGHVNKVTSMSSVTSEGYSGSTGWHNSVRARWYLYHETEQDEGNKPMRTRRLGLELQKSNLGGADERIAWRWSEQAHMFLPEEAQSNYDRVTQQRDERHGILLAMKACAVSGLYVPSATTGRRTAFHVLSAQPVFAESMRSGKLSVRRFWKEIEHLRAIRHIEDSSIRRIGDRKSVAILVLSTEGLRACG